MGAEGKETLFYLFPSLPDKLPFAHFFTASLPNKHIVLGAE